MPKHAGTFFLLRIVISAAILASCTEEDHTVQVPNYFLASPTSVTLSQGSSARVLLSGGVRPYAIARQPKANVASATLDRDTLTINAVGAGSETVALKDSSNPVQTLSVSIHVQ